MKDTVIEVLAAFGFLGFLSAVALFALIALSVVRDRRDAELRRERIAERHWQRPVAPRYTDWRQR